MNQALGTYSFNVNSKFLKDRRSTWTGTGYKAIDPIAFKHVRIRRKPSSFNWKAGIPESWIPRYSEI